MLKAIATSSNPYKAYGYAVMSGSILILLTHHNRRLKCLVVVNDAGGGVGNYHPHLISFHVIGGAFVPCAVCIDIIESRFLPYRWREEKEDVSISLVSLYFATQLLVHWQE